MSVRSTVLLLIMAVALALPGALGAPALAGLPAEGQPEAVASPPALRPTPRGGAAARRSPTGTPVPGPSMVRFKRAQFDPGVEAPRVAAPLRPLLLPADAAPGRYLIVQFNQVIRDSLKARAEAAGAELLAYVPDSAFLARIAPGALEAVRKLPFVRWVGPFHPAYRVSERLDRYLGSDQPVVVTVGVLPGGKPLELARDFADLGAAVLSQPKTDSGRTEYLRLRLPGRLIAPVARADGVDWVEEFVAPRPAALLAGVPANDAATDRMGVAEVRRTWGYYGSGQIVAVADSGLDTGYDAHLQVEAEPGASGVMAG